jgi:hypothetical protein
MIGKICMNCGIKYKHTRGFRFPLVVSYYLWNKKCHLILHEHQCCHLINYHESIAITPNCIRETNDSLIDMLTKGNGEDILSIRKSAIGLVQRNGVEREAAYKNSK